MNAKVKYDWTQVQFYEFLIGNSSRKYANIYTQMLITALFIGAKKRKANYIFNNKEVEMLCSHLKYCKEYFRD